MHIILKKYINNVLFNVTTEMRCRLRVCGKYIQSTSATTALIISINIHIINDNNVLYKYKSLPNKTSY